VRPIGIYRSSLFSLLESVECSFLLEFDLNVAGGEFAVGSLDGTNAVVQEMLLGLVESDLGEGRAVESNSGPVSNNGGGQQEFIENGSIDSGQSSAVGPLKLSILLHPSGLDASVGDDENSLLESLLKFGDELLVSIGEEDFVSSVGDADKDEGFVLVVGDFLDFVDEDGAGELLVFGVHVGGSLDDGAADLVLEVGKVAALDSLSPLEDVVDLLGIGHCGKTDIY
jgi:hypothetical protein